MRADVPGDGEEQRAGAGRNRNVLVGLIGVIVGGAFSLAATWITLDNQAQRELEAQHRLAVGAARVMIAAFDNGTRRLCTLGYSGNFLRATPPFRPEVTPSDRALVAGELTTDEAQLVGEGDHAMATWEGLYGELRRAVDEGGTYDRRGLNRSVERAMNARKALERVADYGAETRVTCNTQTWTLNRPG